MINLQSKIFTDADGQIIPYDDSSLRWRVSAYSLIFKDNSFYLSKTKGEKLYDVVGGGVEFDEEI
ncbi:hypothetical protein GYA19_05715 [Candidatus Beckwithbacteria bacterium]|nr:hypothetical protein [Candidatus Beckwithbacteria bacterium]